MSDPARKDPPERHEPQDLRQVMLRETPVRTAFRLNYVANSYTAGLYKRMEAEEGITRAQFIVLLCLSVRDGTTAQEIAEATHRPKNSLSRAVRALEEKGLIERRQDPGDQRRQPMGMSAAGRKLFRRLEPMASRREAEMLAPLTPAERETLSLLLIRMALVF